MKMKAFASPDAFVADLSGWKLDLVGQLREAARLNAELGDPTART